MRVSVIIPALNEQNQIAQAVTSAWGAGADQVLVVDGGSQDETGVVARQAGATLLASPLGRAQQLNAGAAAATGDLLLFLHADNWLGPDCLRQARQAIGQGFVHGAFWQQIEADGLGYRLLERGNACRVRAFGLPYGDQGIFIKRDAFEAAGRFPDKRLMEDWLLMKRFRRRHWPALLRGPIHVSPRRWQRYGLVRQTMRNLALSWAAQLGIDPDRLAGAYPVQTPCHPIPGRARSSTER